MDLCLVPPQRPVSAPVWKYIYAFFHVFTIAVPRTSVEMETGGDLSVHFS